MVPAVAGSFDTDGTPLFGATDPLRVAALALIAHTPGNMLVYHRETAEGALDGTGVAMTGALVSDKAAVLRSRRD